MPTQKFQRAGPQLPFQLPICSHERTDSPSSSVCSMFKHCDQKSTIPSSSTQSSEPRANYQFNAGVNGYWPVSWANCSYPHSAHARLRQAHQPFSAPVQQCASCHISWTKRSYCLASLIVKFCRSSSFVLWITAIHFFLHSILPVSHGCLIQSQDTFSSIWSLCKTAIHNHKGQQRSFEDNMHLTTY